LKSPGRYVPSDEAGGDFKISTLLWYKPATLYPKKEAIGCPASVRLSALPLFWDPTMILPDGKSAARLFTTFCKNVILPPMFIDQSRFMFWFHDAASSRPSF
jgi:hypothetical protein